MNKETRDVKRNGKLFQLVYNHVINRIERGEWGVHDKLPSIRQLAELLGVHRLTVFRAYQMLKQNKKVYVKEKSGYYVSPCDLEQSIDGDEAYSSLIISDKLKNSMSEIQQVPVDYQFSQALIDPNLLPNLYLSDYVKRVFDLYPKIMGTYSPVQGDEELRESLCDYMQRQHSIPFEPNDMLISNGAQQGIDLLSRIFIRPLDAVMVERPTYSAALDIFRQQGARFVPIDIHPYGYDLDDVENMMKKYKPRIFYMNPTFQNPTGYTIPSSQRKHLVELAEKYQCLLIEDDALYEMYFEEKPPQPLLTYDTDGWVVYLRSFSKYVAPGLRICAIVASKSLMKALVTAKSLADNGTALVNQKIFLHYFQSKRMQQHLQKLRIALHIRRDTMEKELESTNWSWISPKGGLNLWIQLPESIPMDQLLHKCIQQSVSFVPGPICDPIQNMDSRIRLSYSFLNESHLKEGVSRLIEVAKRFE